jgi:hypothetical protein
MDSIVKQLPTLTPLRNSFAVDDVEEQLKVMFIDLFDALFALDFHDTNTLGAAHLGTLDLVRKMLTIDGLVLISNNREEPATRRLYRAWKAGHLQGRGLHFLRAYLQLLFPNSWTVSQQMQVSEQPYPTALFPAESFVDDPTMFLTSRVKIEVAADEENAGSIGKIAKIIKDIVPARIVPEISLIQTSFSELRIGSFMTPYQILNTSGTTL